MNLHSRCLRHRNKIMWRAGAITQHVQQTATRQICEVTIGKVQTMQRMNSKSRQHGTRRILLISVLLFLLYSRATMHRKHAAKALAIGAAGLGLTAVSLLPQTAGCTEQPSVASQVRSDRIVKTSRSKDELQLVQVVFRHGARTPLGSKYWQQLVDKWDVCGTAYEACPLHVVTAGGETRPLNEDDKAQVEQRYPGGCSKGELTLQGQRQALDFGQWLRWRYIKDAPFLPREHQEGALSARTTNYARTVATLQGVLTGLYPSLQKPITAVTTSDIDEIMYANVKACNRLKSLITSLSKEHKESKAPMSTEVTEVQGVMRNVLGLKPEDKVNFVDLHDAITSASAHGKQLPAALQSPQVQKVVEQQATKRLLSVLAPHAESGKQAEVLRLSMGRLIQLMIQNMEAAASGEPTARMQLYSGHDSTILPLLVALGKEDPHWPPYLSHLVFELWKRPSSGTHYVKVLYNRKPLRLSELCPEGEGRGASCPLDKFKQHVLGAYLLTQDAHREECTRSFHHDRPVGDPGSVEEHRVSIGAALED